MRLDGRYIGGLDAASENAFWKAVIKNSGARTYSELAKSLYDRQQLANENTRKSKRYLSASYKDKTGTHVVQFMYSDFEEVCGRRGNFIRHLIDGHSYTYVTAQDYKVPRSVRNDYYGDDINDDLVPDVDDFMSDAKSDISKGVEDVMTRAEIANAVNEILNESKSESEPEPKSESKSEETSSESDKKTPEGIDDDFHPNVCRIDKNLVDYDGVLGKFRYNSKLFKIMKSDKLNYEFLHYIGTETDGAKIEIPEGCIDCNHMFHDRSDLTSAPVIREDIVNCQDMFHGCKRSVISQGKWQIEHRGEVYSKGVDIDISDDRSDEPELQ